MSLAKRAQGSILLQGCNIGAHLTFKNVHALHTLAVIRQHTLPLRNVFSTGTSFAGKLHLISSRNINIKPQALVFLVFTFLITP